MIHVRRIGALLLVALALGVWFGMAPSDSDAPDHGSEVAAIELDDDTNNLSTAGAPQQQVVNGWTTTAYLKLLSEQLDENASPTARDDRPAAMLGLVVVGIALLAATSSRVSGPSPFHSVAPSAPPLV